MNREEACAVLRINPEATREEIEEAYRRLVRRYPPEFQPERFRGVDDAYRFLTSLPYLLERLLSPEMGDQTIHWQEYLACPPPPRPSLGEAVTEMNKSCRLSFLWRPGEEMEKKGGDRETEP